MFVRFVASCIERLFKFDIRLRRWKELQPPVTTQVKKHTLLYNTNARYFSFPACRCTPCPRPLMTSTSFGEVICSSGDNILGLNLKSPTIKEYMKAAADMIYV